MKRKYKVLIIVFSIILILFATFFTTDYIRAKKEKKPIFAVYVAGYDDGGSKKYLGLFYNVYCVKIYYSEPEWLKKIAKESKKDNSFIKEAFRNNA